MTAATLDRLESYDYELPRELIAQEPAANRIDARLMLVDRSAGSFTHHHVRDLPELLSAGDTLVLNNSRVLPARLIGFRTRTRGRWQGLFLRSDETTGVWEVLTKTRGTLTAGETITIEDSDGRTGMLLTVLSRTDDGHALVQPSLAPDAAIDPADFARSTPPSRWLERFGRVPIPPYIRDGHMVDADRQSYQTCYAKTPGSVAAPTAGLHFTQPLLQRVRAAGVATTEVTLHVGIGTFRPIAVDDLSDHQMHDELAEIDQPTATMINERRSRGRTIAVGSTSVRTLESSVVDGKVQPMQRSTDLFIHPPYEFQAVDAMMTNFHLPKSSLLVMVAALAGLDLIRAAYHEAIANEYRFFSYGDAMLIV